MRDEYGYNEVLCSVCGEPATRYIGKAGVLPICDNVVCYTARVEEVNALLQQMRREDLEEVDVKGIKL